MALPPKSLRLYTLSTHGYGYSGLAQTDAPGIEVSLVSWNKVWEFSDVESSHLKPGGWIETQEIHHRPYCRDGSMLLDHPVAQYWGLVSDGLDGLGVDSDATLLLADMMRDAGFVNVTTRIFYVPIGKWPKNKTLKLVGSYWRAILLDGAQPIALGPMTRGLKWSREQVEMQLVEVRRAYMDEWVHSYMPLYIVCGQKPEEA
jgi:hypothetical protein